MKPEQQRIAIVEACGYEYDHTHPNPIKTHFFHRATAEHEGDVICFNDLPDYLNDLNAMHEAILSQVGTAGFVERFNSELMAIVQRDQKRHIESAHLIFWIGNATASQRAEAFLHTIGKWVE